MSRFLLYRKSSTPHSLFAAGFRRDWRTLLRCDRLDVHASPRAIEAHLAVDQREDGVITAEPDVFARQKFRAALSDDDVAGDDYFAAKFFHAQPFATLSRPFLTLPCPFL